MEKLFLKILNALIVTACLGVAIGLLGIADMRYYARTSVDLTSDSTKSAVITITPGDNFHALTRRLANMGMIRSPLKFRLLARLNKQDKDIKAGEYRIVSTLSPADILSRFTSGDVILHRLTIPEGYNLEQIAQSVAAAGMAAEDDFLAAANDPRLIDALKINADSPEGYLFPDTYFFPGKVEPATIIHTMVHRLRALFNPEWEAAAREAGFTIHQVLTLASIIEKETGDPRERALISSVFHKRLKKGMRLASDPTVIYGIPDFDGNLTRKHLRTPGPYNTYLNTGLPPGPIASPGAASIEAALFPAKTSYLFFVSKKDGTHHFSTRFADHQRAVKKYQLTGRKE